jgi:phage anti-repressor protein
MTKPYQILKIHKKKIGEESLQTVNSRDLWKELDIQKDYSDWIKVQIESLSLEENIDYMVYHLKGESKNKLGKGGDRRSIDYIITLDAAKHIAMASRTAKGKEVRKYFIEMEKYAMFQINKQLQRLHNEDDLKYSIMRCQTWMSKTDEEYKKHNEELNKIFIPIYKAKFEIDEFIRYGNIFIEGIENKQLKAMFNNLIKDIQKQNETAGDLLEKFAKNCMDDFEEFELYMSRFKQEIKDPMKRKEDVIS